MPARLEALPPTALSLATLGFSNITNIGLRSSDDATRRRSCSTSFSTDERASGGAAVASSGAAWPILSAAAQEEEEAAEAAERRVGQSVGRRHAKLSTQSRLKQQLARSLSAYNRRHEKEVERKRGRRSGEEGTAESWSLLSSVCANRKRRRRRRWRDGRRRRMSSRCEDNNERIQRTSELE